MKIDTEQISRLSASLVEMSLDCEVLRFEQVFVWHAVL